MQYFVLGGFSNPLQVLDVMRETASNINQGQTGTYQLLIFANLKVFGASLLALRVTSILFSLLFIITSLLFLRRRHVNWKWQTFFILLLSGSATLMLYASEARVYMALVGLTTSALLYYSFAPHPGRMARRVFGWLVVPFLALMSPYAVFYLPLAILSGWLSREERTHYVGVKGLLRWAQPAKITVAALLYFGLASQTWLQGTATFSEQADPFEFLTRPLLLAMAHDHLMPIFTQPTTLILWAVVLVAAIAVRIKSQSRREALREFAGPIALLSLALLASASITLLSLSQGYWIVPRQWTASIALSILAFTWLLAVMDHRLRLLSRNLGRGFTLAVTIIAVASVFSLASFQANKWILSVRTFNETKLPDYSQEALQSRVASADSLSYKDWIRYSQQNAVSGGEVWPELSLFYLSRDWSTFEIVTDPNQLGIYD